MSSGGWELVGKNKKDKNYSKTAKLTKAEKIKFTQNAPKVEDFLPLNQVKTLYDNLELKKENKRPNEEKENKAKENHDKKKQTKTPSQSTGTKKKQEPKGKSPKINKDPSNMIDGEELNNAFLNLQTQYPEFPLIWLKGLASYLSTKIPTDGEDPIFSKKPKNYPLSSLSEDVVSTLVRAIDLAGQKNTASFYEITLTTMCNNMIQGLPVIGQKIFLQLLVTLNSKILFASIPKLTSLRNSYQNRKEIGLSLLWAISQPGKTNFLVSLRVWQEVVSPLLSNKTYTNYVIQNLNNLVSAHPNNADLTPELYFDIIEDLYAGKLNTSNNLGQERNVIVQKLRFILFNNKQINFLQLFQILFGKINQKLNQNYRDEFVGALADCLVKEPLCFNFWQSVLSKNLYQSHLLLSYLNSNWNTLSSSLDQETVKEILSTCQTKTENLKKGAEDTLIHSCNQICKKLLQKMTVSKKSTFPWKKGCIILLIIISGIITLDVWKHESLRASNVGRFLKSHNIDLNEIQIATTVKGYISKGSQVLEANFPEYYKIVVDFSTPYVKLSQDFYLFAKNLVLKLYQNTMSYTTENASTVERNFEHYFPGLLKEIRTRSNHAFELTKLYSNLIGQKAVDYYSFTYTWLETNVFVGKLSPENLQNYANHAIESTQTFASQTYDWVYEKVQTLSKVP